MKYPGSPFRYLAPIATVGVSATYLFFRAKNTESRKDFLQLKTNNKPTPVPIKLKVLVDEVLKDMNLSEEEKNKIKPFMCKSRDVTHVNFTPWDKGTYLGLPQYFLLDKNDDNNFLELVVEVEGKELPMNQQEKESLKKSLSLSWEARKFAVAQELFISQHIDVVPFGILPLLVATNFNLIGFTMDASKNLKNKRPVLFHWSLLFSMAILYVSLLEYLLITAERTADVMSADLGVSYKNGGIEYYQKMLQRNKLIKKFNEKLPYGEDGDLKYSFATGHLSFSERLEFLKNYEPNKHEIKLENKGGV